MAAGWATIQKELQLDPPEPFGHFLGCGQSQSIISDKEAAHRLEQVSPLITDTREDIGHDQEPSPAFLSSESQKIYVRKDIGTHQFRMFKDKNDHRFSSSFLRRTYDLYTGDLIAEDTDVSSLSHKYLNRRLPSGVTDIRTEIYYRPRKNFSNRISSPSKLRVSEKNASHALPSADTSTGS